MAAESLSVKYADAYINPQGPGDARPTALQVLQHEGLQGALAGKTILITGCSSGIGVETARVLYQTGARLFLTVRDTTRGQEVVEEIKAFCDTAQGSLELLDLHLDSLESVRQCAKAFLQKSSKLNILILNAGVMAFPEGQTKEGFETHFGTNYLAHFLLFQLLQPALLSASTPNFNSRVISLSSFGHAFSSVHFDDLDLKKQGYNKWTAYGQSKTANLWLANEIERRFGSQGLHALSLHPGIFTSKLGRYVTQEDIELLANPEESGKIKSVEQGAATSIWAAISPEWEGRGGKYLEDLREADLRKGREYGGRAPYAYDVEGSKQLWDASLALVGLQKT